MRIVPMTQKVLKFAQRAALHVGGQYTMRVPSSSPRYLLTRNDHLMTLSIPRLANSPNAKYDVAQIENTLSKSLSRQEDWLDSASLAN